MSRKNFIPGSNKSDKQIINYDTKGFGAGVISGQAASKLPDNALANAYDVIIYPDDVVGRNGTSIFTSIEFPPIDNRTGYTASKSGYVITTTTSHFTQDDVSNYFVFPDTPKIHYVITEYISGTQVRTAILGDHSSTSGCYLRGKVNLAQWHKIARKWILMFGQQIYTALWNIPELIRCRIISRDLPNNAVSGYDDLNQYSALIHNSNGMFRIDLEREIPIVYKINIPIPNIAILDQPQAVTSEFNYRYLFSGARLFEDDNLVSRLNSRIEQETGSNIWDEDYRDYTDVFSIVPVGEENYTYGILTCGTLSSPYNNVGGWNSIGTPFSFVIDMNGLGDREIVGDATLASNMAEVAAIIQISLRDFFANATCVFDTDHFIITSGREDRGIISFIKPGVASGTTDVSAHIAGTIATGASRSFPYTDSPNVIGPLYVNNVPNTNPQEYQWHITHFPIYRTKDLEGRYKIGVDADQFNNPNDFIWVHDLRVCGAFFGYIQNNYFYAEHGEFEVADVGSTLELDNGERYEILEYISVSIVRILAVGYYSQISGNHAAAIGNGRVIRASQTGNTVTRVAGGVFTSADVRKPLKWATGYYSYITEFVDANTVRVADNQDKVSMGATIDPVYRYFNDTISDTTIDARLGRLTLKARYWEAMPNGNIGKVVPGLIFNAQRGDGTLNYGQIDDTLEYLHGFHQKGYQITDVIAEDIQFMWLFQDILIIWTSRKTWRWPTAGEQYVTNQFTNLVIKQIAGMEVADEDRGCYDWGSIEPIGEGKIMMLTNEPGKKAWRSYNGYQYGPDVLELSQIGKELIPDIQKLQQATRALYANGLLLFGKE